MSITQLNHNHQQQQPVPTDIDETEYSTSFGDTTSVSSANDDGDSVTDSEVESSNNNNNNNLFSDDDFSSVLRVRKKRLTNHWKSFVRPLMWRCKWAELKIKQFESQALKYAKKIAAADLTKHLASSQPIPEGFSSRSMPYTQRRQRKFMKRRKRVRVEETTNADLYMSRHVLFSYHDSKKSDPDEISLMDDFDEPEQNTTSQEVLDHGLHTNWSFLENDDNDMEQLLQKIDMADTRVQKLKTQLDLVISENAQMFPSEAQTSAIHSPTFSTCNADAVSVGGLGGMTRHNSELDLEGLEMSEHAVSNYGEGFHIPDIIESTVGTLSVDVTRHQSQTGDSCEKILDNMLVHDEPTEAERHTLRSCQNQVIVKQERVKSEEQESTHQDVPMETDTATKDAVQQELKPCIKTEIQIPTTKRKRGERKGGSGNWSRQRPGEADN